MEQPQTLTRSLAQVEWQLVMHYCRMQDLLTLARCSRTTLAAASTPFAWAGRSPVPLQFDEDRLDLSSRISSSLLRFAPSFAIEWLDTYDGAAFPAIVLSALLSLPRVVSLRARGCWNRDLHARWKVTAKHWHRILASDSPLTRSLTSLFVGHADGPCLLDSRCLSLLADHCPNLRTLSLTHDSRMQRYTYCSGALAQMRNLTELSISGEGEGRMIGVDYVALCTRLTRLRLRSCSSQAVLLVLKSPNMRSLRHLTLDTVKCGLLSTLDWSACFASLRLNLHSLTIRQCWQLDSLLPAIALAAAAHDSALTAFVVAPMQLRVDPDILFSPTPKALEALMKQLQPLAESPTGNRPPHLRCSIQLPSPCEPQHKSSADYFQQLLDLQLAHPDRLSVVTVQPSDPAERD